MNNPINDGGAAFPRASTLKPDGKDWTASQEGMSLRDWFAGMALQGILANPGYSLFQADEQTIGDVTNHANRIAKLMIQARTKGGQDE